MIEKYPKLVQTFALQPHLCYDLMCVWEENCLDLLLNDELVSLKDLLLHPYVAPIMELLMWVGGT